MVATLARAGGCALWLCSGLALSADLAAVDLALKGGAAQLAIRLVERNQPSMAEDPQGWVAWELERVRLRKQTSDWKSLLRRYEGLAGEVPDAYRDRYQRTLAEAMLAQDRAQDARRYLRELLWQEPAMAPTQLAALRELMVRAYLAEGRIQDAQTALLRLVQAYGESESSARLRAEILLRQGASASALTQLQRDPSVSARLLALQTRLAVEGEDAMGVARAARTLVERADLSPAQRAKAWWILVQASERLQDYHNRIMALEQLLGQGLSDELAQEGLADRLWQAYLDYGQRVGNEAQLLLGEDQAWFDHARGLFDSEPVRARAIYALIALRGKDARLRSLSHMQLGLLLEATSVGAPLLQQLYLHSTRFQTLAAVPESLRYRLSDFALAQADFELAGQLMQDLSDPPPGADVLQWHLTRARVLIFGGRHDAGAAALQGLIDRLPPQQTEPLDRMMQVVFDLQTVKQHTLALPLLKQLLARQQSDQRRRELWYWMAESHEGEGEYAQAAYAYLQSAMLLDPQAMDPWAQTARYHAALALRQAGLLEDARKILRQLLQVTQEPGRRAVLQREIQQLRLHAQVTPDAASAQTGPE